MPQTFKTLLVSIGLTFALLAAPGVATATPQAEGRGQAITVDLASGKAPSCIKRKVTKGPVRISVKVTNKCGIGYRVKVVFKRALDSGCQTIWAGKSKTFKKLRSASYSKTVTCV